MALGDAILACLTERPMTGYELAKTFDASIGFFWKADHQQIYRELSRLRDRGHIQGREVVQSGKPNKLVYTLTAEGRAALRHWARPAERPAVDQGRSAGAAVRARQRRHRTFARRPDGAAGTSPRPLLPLRTHSQQALPARRRFAADTGKLLGLRIGLRHERAVAEWCEEALDALSATADGATVTPLDGSRRRKTTARKSIRTASRAAARR